MAVVKFGTIVTDMKGKIGGQVFQGGNNSKVLRNNNYKSGTSSSARQAANLLLTNQSIRWRSLNSGQRAAWDSAALTWAFVDKFGNTYYGSGYQCFMAYNSGSSLIGGPFFFTPNVAESPEALVDLEINADDSTVMDVSFDSTTTVQQNAAIYMTGMLNVGRNPSSLRYKFIDSVDTSVSNSFSISSAYNAVYGGRKDGAVIYWFYEIRVQSYPRAVLRTYGSLTVV